MSTCSADGCERPVHTHTYELCLMHYKRFHRTGRLAPLTLEERFWSKVDKNGPIPEHRPDLGPCWPWTGFINPETGYGTFSVDHTTLRRAHQIAYTLTYGAIPEGMVPDHLCRNRPCANPTHLEVVTQQENLLRSPITWASINAAKTECPQGHPYDEANTYLIRTGGRMCRACSRERMRQQRLQGPRLYVPETSSLEGQTPCSIEGCERRMHTKVHGLCLMHYKRWKRTGTPGGLHPRVV